jgi:altronate dehydratase
MLLGYARPDGQTGIRNHVAVIYTNDCSKVVARKIAAIVPGVHVFGWPHGCNWSQVAFDKLVALCCHPNIAGVLVVGIGCERIRAPDVVEAVVAKSAKAAASVVIEAVGGTLRSVEEGARLLMDIARRASETERVPLDASQLVLGVDCAGSDATSGLASNPATGAALDLHLDAGGTGYFLDVPSEMIGCGDCLAERACNTQTADELKRLASVFPDDPTMRPPYGNVQGGITTYRGKAAGALAKAGTHRIEEVFTEFKRPTEKGLYMVSAPPGSWTNETDPQCVMILAACGAHLVVETTGCGTVTGAPIVPVLKVCANRDTSRRLADNIDIDVSAVMEGEKTIAAAGQEIYEEVLRVAAGRLTCSEILGHFED